MQINAVIDPLLPSRDVRTACNNISRMTLYRWVREGRFPAPVVLGTRNAWRASEVQAWIEAQQKADPRALRPPERAAA